MRWFSEEAKNAVVTVIFKNTIDTVRNALSVNVSLSPYTV